jgi:hypothetical protein
VPTGRAGNRTSVPLGLAGGAVWCPRPAPAPVNSIEYRCVRPTHRAAPYLPLGPVPHEVIVDIVDEVVLRLVAAGSPSV